MPSQTNDPIQPFWVLDSVRYLKRVSRIPAIAHFYKFRASENISTSCAVPDGAIDIIVECNPGTSEGPVARICGPVNQGRLPGFVEGHTYFGIRLHPELLSHVGDASVAELADQEYDLGDLAHDGALLERICLERDFVRQAQLFEAGFINDAGEAPCDGASRQLARAAIDEINRHHGTVRVERLAQDLGYSRRHLSRCFSATMGMDVKTFSRHARFQYVLHGIRDGLFDTSSDAAIAAGYYDQSHFQKDFRSFTNTTPRGMMTLFREGDYAHRIELCA